MTDADLIAKRLAFIETCVAQLRAMAKPELVTTDIREERFVEHTLQLAIQAHDPWARPALTLYHRAVALTPSLCGTLATYGVAKEVGCRR